MRFAKRTFLIAGIYGLIVLLPQYFLEAKTGRDFPPPITHPEFYYGFLGVTVAWQVLYLFLSTNPVRYRPLMILGILAKASFVIAVLVLFLQNRVSSVMLGAAVPDLVLGLLFLVAYMKTPGDRHSVTA
jgi:hypothetical protein